MTQPAGRAAYCQSKARYCWNIFLKISPYNLMGRGVRGLLPSHAVELTPQWPAQVSCVARRYTRRAGRADFRRSVSGRDVIPRRVQCANPSSPETLK